MHYNYLTIVVLVFNIFSFVTILVSEAQIIPLNFRKLDLPSTSNGPESISFDLFGRGPYVGISDGRVVKYDGTAFVDAYITSPNRTQAMCDGTRNNSAATGMICGRPLGHGFDYLRNEFYIADASLGLFIVEEANDRLALPVPSDDGGQPYKVLEGLDVDPFTGDVYFTDASSRFGLSQIPEAVAANDSTGRLLKYERRTKRVTVLLSNLGWPAGVALSYDHGFVLVTEYISMRIQKLWLRGPKASQRQTIATLNGRPDNIRQASTFGAFWVALNEQTSNINVPKAVLIDDNGNVLRTYDLSREYYNTTISDFQPNRGRFYVGSLEADFVGVYY